MICFHQWENPFDGYQKCSKCGILRIIPCNHQWKTIKEENIISAINQYNKVIGYFFVQECKKCGEIQSFTESLEDY